MTSGDIIGDGDCAVVDVLELRLHSVLCCMWCEYKCAAPYGIECPDVDGAKSELGDTCIE